MSNRSTLPVTALLDRLNPRRTNARLLAFVTILLFASLTLAWTGRASAAEQGPVAEYSFDEDPGEGTSIEDLSGDGHTATIEGATWTEDGRYGGAMQFKASAESKLSIADSDDLDGTEEFTLEAWVRPESEAEWETLFAKESSTSPYYSYLLYARDHDARLAAHLDDGTKERELTSEPAALRQDAWTHVALTFDGATARLYIDGTLVATHASPQLPATNGKLSIGGNTIWGEYFTGRIDEVRIYERALTAGEIGYDMEAPILTPKHTPVASYSFDETEGGTVEDTTGDGHTATIENATRTPHGHYGGAVEFEASKDAVVKIPDSTELDFSEEFTVEAWVRPSLQNGEYAPAVIKAAGTGEASQAYAYRLDESGAEYHHPRVAIKPNPGTTKYMQASTALPKHAWSHIAFTYDGADMHIFINGVEVNKAPSPSPAITKGALEIGGASGLGSYFDGRIDEVRVYNRTLTSAEIAIDMETPLETPKTGPVASWSLDEGTGTTTEDGTGHNHTATLEGGTGWAKGRYGSALTFLKSGDCASVPDSSELRLGEEFTVEAWTRPDGGIYEDPLVVRESGGKDLFGIGLGSREEGFAEAFIGEGASSKAAVGGHEIREYEWVHVAATWDGATIRLYVDGELAATKATTTAPGTGAGALRIGCDTPNGPFDGRIDEVQVYNRAITAAEVAGDMQEPLRTPRQTPVAAYSFDEVKEGTVEDRTGDGHTATIEGAIWTEHGRYGGALEFDAANEDVVKIPASAGLNFSEEFTLEAWVRPSGAGNYEAPLIDKQEGSGVGYFLYEGGSVSDRPVGAVEEGQEHVHADDPLPTHAWSHVALTFIGNRTFLYVDGELIDNGAAEPVVTPEGELEIGGSTDTGDYFDGRIDEVRIYNRGLSQAEVGADMQAAVQTPALGPVTAYSFDEGTGTTVKDLSGEGHTATIEGATWTTHGRFGNALQFNGTSSCVSIADAADLHLGEDFTLESWVRPEGELKHDPVIFKEGSGHLNYALEVGTVATGKAEGAIGTTTSPNYKVTTATEALKANVWNHLAVTFDGSLLRLYVNGTLVDYEEVEGADSARAGALKIGCDSQYGEHFKGRIDEVRIYDRSLTAGEIAHDMAPQGMTASYVLEEEEEAIQAEAVSFYPENESDKPSKAAFVRTRVTLFGAPIGESEEGSSLLAKGNKREKPYQFAECYYSHNEPGVVGGKTSGPSRKVLGEFALEAAKDAQKAAKTTKPHGLPKCDGTLEPKYFHFQWGDEIWGDFFYEPNERVWIEEPPQCEAWSPESVELEWEEYEQKVREHRNPHKPKRQRAKPKEELCYAPHWESTEVPGGIDVVSRVSWTPAFLFRNGGTEREKVCGQWEGHLTANPPDFQENGLRQVYKSHHLHWFYEPRGLKCDWSHPGGDIKSEP